MKLVHSLQTRQINRDLLAQFIIEKQSQFGFNNQDDILELELCGLPELITMKIKVRKEQEVEVLNHNVA